MEFIRYHSGTSEDPTGLAPRKLADKIETSKHKHLPPSMAMKDPRAPDRWNASLKVRHHETVHLPEYAGWHNGKKPPADNAAWSWVPTPGNGLPVHTKKFVSRGPNLRVSENAGFSWDPAAPYGPETVQALPRADDKSREGLFDESADQRYDGVPDTGIFAFGRNGGNVMAGVPQKELSEFDKKMMASKK